MGIWEDIAPEIDEEASIKADRAVEEKLKDGDERVIGNLNPESEATQVSPNPETDSEETLQIPSDLLADLIEEAKKIGVSVSDFIEIALDDGTPLSKYKKKRLKIKLPQKSYDDLKGICESVNISLAKLVRTGLGLAKLAYMALENGNRLVVVNKDSEIIKQVEVPSNKE